jgi:hypothetical protein
MRSSKHSAASFSSERIVGDPETDLLPTNDKGKQQSTGVVAG